MLHILTRIAQLIQSVNGTAISAVWVSRKIGDKIEDYKGQYGGVTDVDETSAFIFDDQHIRYDDVEARDRADSCTVARKGRWTLKLIGASNKYDAYSLEERLRESIEQVRQIGIEDVQNYGHFQFYIRESNFDFKEILRNYSYGEKWNSDFSIIAIEFELQFVWSLNCPTSLQCKC